MIIKINNQIQTIFLTITFWIVYIVLLPFLYNIIGHSYTTFVIIPIVLTALLNGMIWGVFAGLLGLPLNLALFHLFSYQEFDFIFANGIPAWLASILVGFTIGKLRDLEYQLKNEQNERSHLENKYKKLIEQAPVIVYSFSTKRGGIYTSSQVSSILGYTPEHLYKNPYLWNTSIHPDDHEMVSTAISNFIDGTYFDIEYRIKNAAGKWIWLRDRSINRIEIDDEIIIDGIATEITQQKEILESLTEKNYQAQNEALEKNSLLEEVNHRVKNNLNLIIGILNIEKQENQFSEETEKVILDVISRIQNIGIVHDVLTKSNWEDVSLQDIIPPLVKGGLNCSVIRDSIKTTFVFPKSEIKISSKLAFKIAIVINELTINTIKYAFTDRQEGEIEITIQEPLPRHISITYWDNGPGWPQEIISNKKGSIGTKLIRNIITKDLEGSLEIFNNNGAEITFQFKI